MKNHYLLDTESVKTYLTEQLGIFSSHEYLTAEEIGRNVHTHPTLSEAMKEAAEGVGGHMINF